MKKSASVLNNNNNNNNNDNNINNNDNDNDNDIYIDISIESLTKNKAYSCYTCNETFTCKRNLEYHLSHNVCVREEQEREKQMELSYRTCFLCLPKKVLSNRLSFRTHLRKIHQIGKMADYEQLLNQLDHWSMEVNDNWGRFICRDHRWTNKVWLNERWEYLLGSENMYSDGWKQILGDISENQIQTPEDIMDQKMEIFYLIDDLFIKFFNELPNSPFNETYSVNSTNSTNSTNTSNSLSAQNSLNGLKENQSFLTEMVWLEFFASLPTTTDIIHYMMRSMIKLSKQIRSSYLIKKWFYPLNYWILWLRWNLFMNYKTHWKSFHIQEWMHLYISFFDLNTYLPINHHSISNQIQTNAAESCETDLMNNGNEIETIKKKNGIFFMTFD
jgi:hypothetical protein